MPLTPQHLDSWKLVCMGASAGAFIPRSHAVGLAAHGLVAWVENDEKTARTNAKLELGDVVRARVLRVVPRGSA